MKYLHFIILCLLQLYLITSTPFQWYKQYTIHSCIYIFIATYTLTSFHIYWMVYFIDSNIIIENPELNKLPLYYLHFINSMGVIVIITDALLWKPKRIPFLVSYIPCCMFISIYIAYLEITNSLNDYIELPDSDILSILYRFLYYLLLWLIITIFNIFSYVIIRLLHLKKKQQMNY
ncbi:unnamed protein product [Schistosoma intercalatum]|nr:unnamed protein product [Schistosoma intercalatum]